jgi:Na+/proline symporter
VAILLLAYVSYRLLGSTASLATIGQIAFAAITQLAPAMVGALYWKQANRRGVFAGLTAGAAIWFYTLILPLLGWPLDMFPGLSWMYNGGLGFGLSGLTLGVTLSLIGNATLFFWVSILTQTHVAEHWQASRATAESACRTRSPHRR